MAFIVTIAREGAHQINLTPEESPAQLECPKDPGLYGLFSGIRGHSGGPAGRQQFVKSGRKSAIDACASRPISQKQERSGDHLARTDQMPCTPVSLVVKSSGYFQAM